MLRQRHGRRWSRQLQVHHLRQNNRSTTRPQARRLPKQQWTGQLNNSKRKATSSRLTDITTTMQMHLTLTLENYLTPSLNTLLNAHWTKYTKQKKLARTALLSAIRSTLSELQDSQPRLSTLITSLEAANLSLTKLDTPNSSQTITPKASKSRSVKSKSALKLSNEPKSGLPKRKPKQSQSPYEL